MYIEALLQPYRENQQPTAEALNSARKFLEACKEQNIKLPTVFINHTNHYEFVVQPKAARWTLEIDNQGKLTIFINGITKEIIETSTSTSESAVASLQSFITSQKYSPLKS